MIRAVVCQDMREVVCPVMSGWKRRVEGSQSVERFVVKAHRARKEILSARCEEASGGKGTVDPKSRSQWLSGGRSWGKVGRRRESSVDRFAQSLSWVGRECVGAGRVGLQLQKEKRFSARGVVARGFAGGNCGLWFARQARVR